MGILEGKNILVTGVTMDTSIAYRVAEITQAEGAKVVVSNLGRAVGLTRRVVGRLATVPHIKGARERSSTTSAVVVFPARGNE